MHIIWTIIIGLQKELVSPTDHERSLGRGRAASQPWVVDDRWGDLRFSQVFMANRSCWHHVGIRLASCWEMRLGVGDCAKPA